MTQIWTDRMIPIAQAAAILAIGLLLTRLATILVNRTLEGRASAQHLFIARRLTAYTIVGLSIAATLRHVGVDLSVLLGAAGIISVALGFASQTSASNLISGLMLMGEQPFVVGDVIKVDDKVGEVVAIDLISVKIRSFDNLLVRIPNETLLKATLTNMTRFPIRRIDLIVSVSYASDLEQVQTVLEEIAAEQPHSLDEPKPVFMVTGFGDSAINLQFSVWCARANFLALKTKMHIAIKKAFADADIEIPFPQRVVHTASKPAAGESDPA